MNKYSGFISGTFVGGVAVAIYFNWFATDDKTLAKMDRPQSVSQVSKTEITNEDNPALTGAESLSPSFNFSNQSEEIAFKDSIQPLAEDIEPAASLDNETVSPEELAAIRAAEKEFIDSYPLVAADAIQQLEIITTQAMARGEWLDEDNKAIRPYSSFVTADVVTRLFKPLYEAANDGSLVLTAPILL